MNRTDKKKILESDPKQLASLIGDDDIGERIWHADELAAILRHQLTSPLHVDLGGIAHRSRRRKSAQTGNSPAEGPEKLAPTNVGDYGHSPASQLQQAAEARGLVLKSFGDLLQHRQPPVGLLKLMKDFAKACRLGQPSAMPREISSVIYFASIIAAMTRGSRRITRLDNTALRQAVDWALAQPWLEDTTRALFLEGQQYLAAAARSGHEAQCEPKAA